MMPVCLIQDFTTSANRKKMSFYPQLLKNVLRSREIRFPSDCELSHGCIDLCRKLLRLNSGTILAITNLKKLHREVSCIFKNKVT